MGLEITTFIKVQKSPIIKYGQWVGLVVYLP